MALPTSWSDCATEEQAIGAIIPASRLNKILGNLLKLGGTTGAPALDKASALLASDVPMTLANANYTGPSVALAAGTWLITGGVCLYNGGAVAANITILLWDGTTQISTAGEANMPAGVKRSFAVSGYVVIAAPATWKIAALSSGTSGIIAKTIGTGGDNASYIYAVRIG